METSRLIHFCAQEVFQFMRTNSTDVHKILICGDVETITQCVDFLQRILGNGILDSLIVASDSITSPLIEKYFGATKLKIVDWGDGAYEDYLVDRVMENETVPVKIAIDFSPTLRRLHRIARIVTWNSLVIIPEEGAGWRSVFPALFAAFEENSTRLINCNFNHGELSQPTNPSSEAHRLLNQGRIRI